MLCKSLVCCANAVQIYGMVTVSYFLDTRRSNKAKKYPFKLRVNADRTNNRSYNTGLYFSEDEYKKLNEQARREPWKDLWIEINNMVKRAEDIVNELQPFFSYEEFKERFFEQKGFEIVLDESSLNYVLERVVKDYMKRQQYSMTVKLRDSVQSILKFSKTPNLPMQSITPKFCRDYEEYMVKKSKTNTRNGAGINMRHIRILFNQAIAMGLVPRNWYPFKRESGEKSEYSDPYVIPNERKVKEYLNGDEVLTMFTAKSFVTDAQKRAHQAWLISYYCNGCNAADFLEFKYRDIKGEFIVFYREKVKNATRTDRRPVKVYLTQDLKDLIKKVGNPPAPNNYIFNCYKSGMTVEQKYEARKQFVNRVSQSLKHLAENLGIKKNLRFGNARHSLANVLKRNNVDREMLKDLFGHTSIITADNYFGDFEEDKQAEIAKNFMSKTGLSKKKR